jgi:hypothetical protein
MTTPRCRWCDRLAIDTCFGAPDRFPDDFCGAPVCATHGTIHTVVSAQFRRTAAFYFCPDCAPKEAATAAPR